VSPYWVVQYDIALMRCTPVTASGDPKNPPTCDQLDENAQLIMRDMATVHLALGCCLDNEDDITVLIRQPYSWLLQGQESIGPDGGCAGSNTTVLVGMSPCREC
jgi:hypothetical protein